VRRSIDFAKSTLNLLKNGVMKALSVVADVNFFFDNLDCVNKRQWTKIIRKILTWINTNVLNL
jgi:hypothetical protein